MRSVSRNEESSSMTSIDAIAPHYASAQKSEGKKFVDEVIKCARDILSRWTQLRRGASSVDAHCRNASADPSGELLIITRLHRESSVELWSDLRCSQACELSKGGRPESFCDPAPHGEIDFLGLLDGREVKHYTYPKKGATKLQTEIGDLDTVIYESQRRNFDGTGRTWRYWFAPSLGFLPVRIEQREDGRARLTFTVRSIKWTGAARPPVN